MKVLLPASEVAPIIKLGGLGDVVGSLPKALAELGVNVDVIVPFYPFAKVENLKLYKSLELNVPYEGTNVPVEVYKTKLPDSDVDVILLKNHKYFSDYGKKKSVGEISEIDMFSFFDRAVVEYIKSGFNTYDLIHCNDWHTGMITHLLSDELEKSRPATLFTVHNLLYQGISSADLINDLGIIPGMHPLIDWDIADGDINFMQQGITSSDFVNTVSPTYAKEILTEEYGGSFADILKAREGRLMGILNGIDYTSFPREFNESNWQEIKPKLKSRLIKEFELDNDGSKPIISFVGRLDPNQKGLDILCEALPNILDQDVNFVLLGDGDDVWKQKLLDISKETKYKGNLGLKLAFDVELAKSIYSGSDFLVVPSKYEPCGLIQMISMWYGTLPVVRDTGGLKDSVKDGKTGIKFTDYKSESLFDAVKKAKDIFYGPAMVEMVNAAIREDFSWKKSAMSYSDLYKKVVQLRLDALK
ncbi:glycogen synthase [candidate division WWE3 bacterium]|jgi:starch synthase|uniref:Glycogen synthase n=1 Tax=candidate division WWE3 bacterium TaxID=2053526 RepID=A0A3A4ZMP9_UNCKA|nr:MAG: glycogen synthase [candidate division WWE3 bacterium]